MTSRVTLANHWDWRPDWTPDRPCLMWYLTFGDQPELVTHVELLQSRLAGPTALDLAPVPWLHLTLDQVGYVDTVPPRQVDDVTDAVRAAVRGWRPGRLAAGPVCTMRTAVGLEVAGADELYHRVHAATALTLGLDPADTFRPFRAHVTLAYANRAYAVDDLLERLGDEAGEQVPVKAPRVLLAAVTRADRHYRWTDRAEVPL